MEINKDSLFFTSDHHFNHSNIIKYCSKSRGHYKDVYEMNEDMIEKWNDTVSDNSTIFHLGDFSFGKLTETLKIIDRLKGNVIFIPGNHDNYNLRRIQFLNSWTHVGPFSIDINVDGQKIRLSHFAPSHDWIGFRKGEWYLHGHNHGNIKRDQPELSCLPCIDVGVDCNEMRPFSFKRVKLEMFKILQNSEFNVKYIYSDEF